MQGQITDPNGAVAFILGGRATVTFRSSRTGTRYTYRIKPSDLLLHAEGKCDRFFVKVRLRPRQLA